MTTEIIYEGQLRCNLEHSFSGTKIITDAPLDNHGKAESFSPTDLIAAAAGSCMLTIMGIGEKIHGYSIEGTRVTVQKVMSDSPRRISGLVVEIFFPQGNNYNDKQKKILENIAYTCPVMISIHPDIEKTITFHY